MGTDPGTGFENEVMKWPTIDIKFNTMEIRIRKHKSGKEPVDERKGKQMRSSTEEVVKCSVET